MHAWLVTILLSAFYSQHRKDRREVEDGDGTMAAALSTLPTQNEHMDFEDFQIALAQIPVEQREALVLVGESGFSYQEAAAICGCATGTIKSRTNRARGRLAELLGLTLQDEAQHVPRLRTSGALGPATLLIASSAGLFDPQVWRRP